jgi:hypothetical protein
VLPALKFVEKLLSTDTTMGALTTTDSVIYFALKKSL